MAPLPIPNVPSSIKTNTGEEELPIRIMEEFFTSVLLFLGYDTKLKVDCFTERLERVQTLFGTEPIITDDKVISLLAKGILVASVIFWRDDLNYIQVVFAHYLDKNNVQRARFQAP